MAESAPVLPQGPVPLVRLLRDLPPAALVCFLGDSITEQNLYTLYVELYLRSRWPEKRLRFVNVGWGGHRASDGRLRLARDVLARDPAVVLVCFGMNDGQYRAPDRQVAAAFRRDLTDITRRLMERGCAVVLLSPPPVDVVANPGLGLCRYNDTLQGLTAMTAAVARSCGATFVDIFGPMLADLQRARAEHPEITFVPDGVHPNPAGHLIMAYHLLLGLGLLAPALSVTLDAAAGQVLHSTGGSAGDVSSDAVSLRCTLRPDAPPFPLPPDAAAGGSVVPWAAAVGRSRIAVVGLRPGTYGVYADGDVLGHFQASELRAGVELPPRPAVQTRWEAAFAVARERFGDHLWAWRRLDPVVAGDQGQGSPEIAEAYRSLSKAQEETLRALLRPLPLSLEVVPEAALRFACWEVAGPYPLQGQDGYTAAFGPERGEPAAWTEAAAHRPEDGLLDFSRLFGPTPQAVAYARCQIHVPAEATLRLRLGSDDGWKVFVNGVLAGGHDVYRGAAPGQDRLDVGLRPGWNALVVRVNNGAGDWQLYCQGVVTDLAGAEAEKVRVALRP